MSLTVRFSMARDRTSGDRRCRRQRDRREDARRIDANQVEAVIDDAGFRLDLASAFAVSDVVR